MYFSRKFFIIIWKSPHLAGSCFNCMGLDGKGHRLQEESIVLGWSGAQAFQMWCWLFSKVLFMSSQCRQAWGWAHSRKGIPLGNTSGCLSETGILSNYPRIIFVVLRECWEIHLLLHEVCLGAEFCPSSDITTGRIRPGRIDHRTEWHFPINRTIWGTPKSTADL